MEIKFNEKAIEKYLALLDISVPVDQTRLLDNLGVFFREGQQTTLNNAGILFFASNPTTIIPQCSVTCVAYKGNSKVDIIDKKTFENDLISNIEECIAFLKRHLNVVYEIKSSRRKEKLEIPEVVLRESVVNAVAHRDYFEKGAGVMIEVFDNRLEISNPGGLPKGLKPEDFGSKTLARNPLIAALLNRAKYIEKLGTGIPRIKQFMSDAGLPDPFFHFDNFFKVVLRRYDPLTELKTDLEIPLFKAKRILVLLEKMVNNEKIEPEKIAEELQTSSRTIRNDLDTLFYENWIMISGETKAREYELTAVGKIRLRKYFD